MTSASLVALMLPIGSMIGAIVIGLLIDRYNPDVVLFCSYTLAACFILSRLSRNQKGCSIVIATIAEGAMASALVERYDDRIAGVLSCYDRVVITGTLPTVCYADGMTRFLNANQHPHLRLPGVCRDAARAGARARRHRWPLKRGSRSSTSARSTSARKRWSRKVLEQRGEHPGLVHVISAMEACDAYKPWHDKQTHKTYLRPDSGKCLHYYFYFMDAELGLIYLRVPTWAPFRLQFYCNGHSWLARQLAAEGIGFTMADNAFIRIDDWQRAQDLADGFSPDQLHRVLDRYAALCCPVLDVFGQTYHWSLMQVEYATDLVFRSAATLGPLYEQLTRQSVLSVKAEQIATFLGRKITPQLAQEIGSQFSTRIEGTCIKHRFGNASIKMYDKFGMRAAHRDHHQRRVLFQAPPKGGTPQRPADPRTRPGQEDDLQPDRPARDTARLQPPLSGASVRAGRLLRRCSCARPADQAAQGRRQDRQGDQLLRSGGQRAAARLAEPAGQHRRHPPGRPAGAGLEHVLADPTVATAAPAAATSA